MDDEAVALDLVLRAFAHVVATVDGASCGIVVPGQRRPQACQQQPTVARVPVTSFDRGVVDDRWSPVRGRNTLWVGACLQHVRELQRRAELRGAAVEFIDQSEK